MEQKSEARSGNYIFTIGDKRSLSAKVQSANLGGVTLPGTPVMNRYKDAAIPSNKVDQTDCSIRMICSSDMSEWIEIYKWMMTLKNRPDNSDHDSQQCSLITLGDNNVPGPTFIYNDAWPTVLGDLFYTTVDESEVLVFDVVLEYNRFSIRLADGTIIDEDYYDPNS